MTKSIFSAVFACSLLGASFAAAQDADVGKTTYQQYCATCHGVDGDGGGPLTEYISALVPDLTTLAASNDGEFPMLEVLHVIDGRTGLRGHGGPMPVYGALFDQESASGTPYGDILYTRGRLLSIAYYLESIQK